MCADAWHHVPHLAWLWWRAALGRPQLPQSNGPCAPSSTWHAMHGAQIPPLCRRSSTIPLPPCRAARRDTTFDNIIKRQPHFPHRGVSAEGRDLISKLLAKVSHTWGVYLGSGRRWKAASVGHDAGKAGQGRARMLPVVELTVASCSQPPPIVCRTPPSVWGRRRALTRCGSTPGLLEWTGHWGGTLRPPWRVRPAGAARPSAPPAERPPASAAAAAAGQRRSRPSVLGRGLPSWAASPCAAAARERQLQILYLRRARPQRVLLGCSTKPTTAAAAAVCQPTVSTDEKTNERRTNPTRAQRVCPFFVRFTVNELLEPDCIRTKYASRTVFCVHRTVCPAVPAFIMHGSRCADVM